jgi:hypothetical protein
VIPNYGILIQWMLQSNKKSIPILYLNLYRKIKLHADIDRDMISHFKLTWVIRRTNVSKELNPAVIKELINFELVKKINKRCYYIIDADTTILEDCSKLYTSFEIC